jgi:hypothetical protein
MLVLLVELHLFLGAIDDDLQLVCGERVYLDVVNVQLADFVVVLSDQPCGQLV